MGLSADLRVEQVKVLVGDAAAIARRLLGLDEEVEDTPRTVIRSP